MVVTGFNAGFEEMAAWPRTNNMTKQEQFFYDNAGSSYDPKTETKEQGQERGARRLAEAETYAAQSGWTFEWGQDDRCDHGKDCDNHSHMAEYCLLSNGDEVLASLSMICGPTSDYRRVVQAELALEAMPTPVSLATEIFNALQAVSDILSKVGNEDWGRVSDIQSRVNECQEIANALPARFQEVK